MLKKNMPMLDAKFSEQCYTIEYSVLKQLPTEEIKFLSCFTSSLSEGVLNRGWLLIKMINVCSFS